MSKCVFYIELKLKTRPRKNILMAKELLQQKSLSIRKASIFLLYIHINSYNILIHHSRVRNLKTRTFYKEPKESQCSISICFFKWVNKWINCLQLRCLINFIQKTSLVFSSRILSLHAPFCKGQTHKRSLTTSILFCVLCLCKL